MTALREVTDRVQTWNPTTATESWEFDYIDLSSVDNASKSIAATTRVTTSGAPSRARQLVITGDVLVSTVRPNLNAVAVVPADLHGATASTGFTVLRPAEHLDHRYLFHWVRSARFIDDMVRKATGASYPAVSDRIVKDSTLPLPALEEQRRIAAILDQADTLRAKRRQALDLFAELGDTLLNDLTREFARTVPLGHVASFFAGGSLPPGEAYVGQVDGHLLMKVSDTNRPGNERIIDSCAQWSRAQGPRSATCPPGSIVIPKRGGAIGTNKKRLTSRSTVLDPNLMAIVPGPNVNLDYLFAWFLRFDLKSISSGSSVPQLNKQDLAPLQVPIPPMTRQLDFAHAISRVEDRRVEHRRQLSLLDLAVASLQARAFSCQL